MLDLVAAFSSKNDNKFNDDLLINFRRDDDMVRYVDDACEAITRLIPDFITYKGNREIDNRKRMLARDESDKDPKGSKMSKNEIRINVSDTFAKEVSFEFELRFGGQTKFVNFTLWIPLLVDGYHFFIRGNKYSCPIQAVDAISYTRKNMLVLKTTTRAIKFEREKSVLTDIYGKKFNVERLMIFITNKSISLLVYYFAAFGFFKTLQYFGTDMYIKLYSGNITDGVPDDKYMFKFGKCFLGVDKIEFDSNRVLRMFVGTCLTSIKRSMDVDYIRNPVRWTSLLGEAISPPKALEKGEALLKTFRNSLDFRTTEIINELVEGTDRNNMFEVGRWLFCNYANICHKDDGLQNKRLRINEYLVSPFIKRFVEKVHRFMNTPVKIKSMSNLEDVFKLKSSVIINAIIGKTSPQITGLNITKFSSESNDCGMVNVLLQETKSGPGSPLEKTKRVGISHREFSIDMLGNLDIIAGSSAGNPGINRYICPINDTFNPKKKIFNIDPKLLVQ